MKKMLILFSCLAVPLICGATGLGSQSWGENLRDYDGGGSRLGLGPLIVMIASWVGCWWLAFAPSSPVKNFWWQFFFMIPAPGILGYFAAMAYVALVK